MPLSVETPLGPGTFSLGFSGREALSEPFRFRVELVAESATPIPADRLIGAFVGLRLDLRGQPVRHFTGICSRVSQGDRDARFTAYELELVPSFWLLTRTRSSRIFHGLSVPELLQQVLAGLDVPIQH